MKHLLFTMMILTQFTSSALASGPLDGPGLREKLIQLFDSSKTPYPMEENAVTSVNVKSFMGCALAYSDGTVDPVSSTPLIVTFAMTRSPEAGPLSPRVLVKATALALKSNIEDLNLAKAVFENGMLNLDPVTFTDYSQNCQNSSPRIDFLHYTSGLTADQSAYRLQAACPDGRIYDVIDARLASGYLIEKVTHNPGQSDSKEIYLYCWK